MCWWPPRGACSTSTGRTPSVSPSCRRWCSTRRTACSTSVSLKNWMRCSPLCRKSARPCCFPRPSPSRSGRWPASCCATRCRSRSARAMRRRRRSSSGWCRWTRSARASCSCICWRSGAGVRCWCSSRRARASISWWTSCRRRASPATRSTATSRRPRVCARWSASRLARCRCWWRPTWRRADWTFTTCRRWSTSTCPPSPRITCIASVVPAVPEPVARRSPWSPLTRWTSWPPSRP